MSVLDPNDASGSLPRLYKGGGLGVLQNGSGAQAKARVRICGGLAMWPGEDCFLLYKMGTVISASLGCLWVRQVLCVNKVARRPGQTVVTQ